MPPGLAAPASLPLIAPFVGAAGEPGICHVHVVGSAFPSGRPRIRRRGAARCAGRSRSAFERGIMWLTAIGSPVSGSAIRQSPGVLVMQVVNRGDRAGRARAGPGGPLDRAHALAAEAIFPRLSRRPSRKLGGRSGLAWLVSFPVSLASRQSRTEPGPRTVMTQKSEPSGADREGQS